MGEEAPYGAFALLQLPLMAGFSLVAQWSGGAILFAKAIERWSCLQSISTGKQTVAEIGEPLSFGGENKQNFYILSL